jgi:carbamoyl-phosphate synthase large subunit
VNPISSSVSPIITRAASDASGTPIARRFHEMGFTVMATEGTAAYLRARGIPAQRVHKVHAGRPNCLDMIVNHDTQLLINTPMGKHAQLDDYLLRQAAIVNRVSYTTTMSAASAACDAILALRSRRSTVRSIQEWQSDLVASPEASGNVSV